MKPLAKALCLVLSSVLAVASGAAEAQSICGVSAITHDAANQRFIVTFDGNKDRKATLDKRAKKLEFDVKDRIVADGKNVLVRLEVDDDDIAYVADGKDESCVFRAGKRDELDGVYIQRNVNVPNKAPIFETEFVQFN